MFKVYRKLNPVYFPWIIDDEWQLVGNCKTKQDVDDLIKTQRELTDSYIYSFQENKNDPTN